MGSGLHEQKFKEYWHGNIAWFDDAEKFDDSNGEVVYSIQKGNEGDHYSYQWTGYFCPIRLGTYTFKLMSDDGGAILTINGQQVLKGGYWGFEVATYEATDLQCVPANIYYGQYSGDARCSFEFELPNNSDSKVDFGAIFFSLKDCVLGPERTGNECQECGTVLVQEVIHKGWDPECPIQSHTCAHRDGLCLLPCNMFYL